MQQIALAAGLACSNVAHVPDADVAYQPSPTVVSPTIGPVVAPRIERLTVPVVVDLLRKRRAGGRPLLGETPLGSATLKTDDKSNTLDISILGTTTSSTPPCPSIRK